MEYPPFRLQIARIASPSFTLVFSLTTRIIKKLLSITKNKKKKHDKIKICMIDMDISHEEFNAIIREK